MNVLYTCDNNYVWLMGISVISLFENNRELSNLHVWLLGEKISEENKEVLSEIGRMYGRIITVIDVPQLDIPSKLVSARWPQSAFTRLYAGELLPVDITKALYIDCDTIIRGNIAELFRWDVAGKVFWGVKDCIGKRYKQNIGIAPDGIYINAGVLLINLQEIRNISIKERLNSYIEKYEELINYADQDILNGAFNKMIGVLPPQYDVMTIVAVYSYKELQTLRRPTNYYNEEELTAAVKKPVLIHYTTNMRVIRPWFSNTNHPFSEEFMLYLKMSPWREKQLDKMIFTSKESKIISIVEKMPRRLSLNVLGILHSVIKPLAVKMKAKKGHGS